MTDRWPALVSRAEEQEANDAALSDEPRLSGKRLRLKEDKGAALPLIAGAMFFLLGVAAFTGMIGYISENLPIEDVQTVKDMYDSIGGIATGTIMFVLSGISGGVWYFMKN